MTINGKLAGYRYETSLTEERCAFEILSGERRGSRRESSWDSINPEPDQLVEVTDIRSLGWILLVVFGVMVIVAGLKQGRMDVAVLVGGPFFALPAALLLIFGKNRTENVVFRHTSGNEAFAVPQADWQRDEVRAFIQRKTEANKSMHPTANRSRLLNC